MAERFTKSGLVVPGLNDHLPAVMSPHIKAARELSMYGGIKSVAHRVGWRLAGDVKRVTGPLKDEIKRSADITGLPVVLFGTSAGGTLGALVALENPELQELERVVLLGSRVNSHGGIDRVRGRHALFAETIVDFERNVGEASAEVMAKLIPVRPRSGDTEVPLEASCIPGVETVLYKYDAVGHNDGIITMLGNVPWLAGLVTA